MTSAEVASTQIVLCSLFFFFFNFLSIELYNLIFVLLCREISFRQSWNLYSTVKICSRQFWFYMPKLRKKIFFSVDL